GIDALALLLDALERIGDAVLAVLEDAVDAAGVFRKAGLAVQQGAENALVIAAGALEQGFQNVRIGRQGLLQTRAVQGQVALAGGTDTQGHQRDLLTIDRHSLADDVVDHALDRTHRAVARQRTTLAVLGTAGGQLADLAHQGVVGVDELLDLGLGAVVVLGDVEGQRRVAVLVNLAEGQADTLNYVVEGVRSVGQLDSIGIGTEVHLGVLCLG